MKVLARFYVAEVTRRAYNASATNVVLQAVSRGEENKSWAAATPTGRIEMAILSGAADWFAERLGKDVLITFEAAEDDEPHKTPYS